MHEALTLANKTPIRLIHAKNVNEHPIDSNNTMIVKKNTRSNESFT